jgi:hypothetical protein
MAGVLTSVFGAPVTYFPAVGDARVVSSVFRETPIEVASDMGGAVLIDAPTWRVSRTLVPEPKHKERIQLADGRQFFVVNKVPTGSPADDGFILCVMERVQ